MSVWLCLGLILAAGCRTAEWPAVDCSQPGWRVRHGQAVWKPGAGRPEIAGELLLATRDDGAAYVQFAKPPLTLCEARSEDARWWFRAGATSVRRGRRGPAPVRLLWLHLDPALRNQPLPSPLRWQTAGATGWRLENPQRDEWIEGFLGP
ncbi:MAG TPA: hypothetical protein VNO52_16040 [Methylomirabilota bacterium]|nr:hypothetical protein [Methylomirabilota bacterium]